MENKVLIIAEAGVNHNGDIEIAKRLIEEASKAGADIVKFQTYHTEKLVCKNAQKAAYQMERTDETETQYDMLKKLELSIEMHYTLIEHCRKCNIRFLSTPFDEDSVNMLEKIGMDMYKIPSGEITNFPYLKKIGSLQKDIILSTGMSTINEVRAAVDILKRSGTKKISILHCNTQYPTPMKDVNLHAILTLKDELGLPVGYSDHTKGIEVPIAAVALGATIIEKHFTLDKDMEGPDHKASADPVEFKNMVAAIRNIEQALGNGVKEPTESEKANINIVRKSIVAKRKILKGELFTKENITVKRPGNGLSPMKWNEIIGMQATKDFEEDELIKI